MYSAFAAENVLFNIKSVKSKSIIPCFFVEALLNDIFGIQIALNSEENTLKFCISFYQNKEEIDYIVEAINLIANYH